MLAHRITGQKGSLGFSLARRGLIKPEGLQTAVHRLLLEELSRARQYCPILKRHILDTVSFRRETKDMHKRCVRIPSPAVGVREKPTTSSMNLHWRWKISFINKRSRSNMYQRYIFLQEDLCGFLHIRYIRGWR